MKAAVWTDIGKLEVREVPTPKIREDQVLLKVHSAGVCVTDLHIYTGRFSYGAPPHILGHEIAGEICQVGSAVTGWREGDRVVPETSIGCGECGFCRSGQRHLCKSLTEIGFTPHNGGYAQYAAVPAANLFRIPDNLSYDEAGIIESVVCPVGSLYRLGVTFGETVAVFGVGPAGIAYIQGAKAMGAGKVIAIARNPERLQRAKSFGADVIIDSRREDVYKRIAEETNDCGADLVCEAAGVPMTVEQSFQVIRRAGRVILYGLPGDSDSISFPVKEIIMNQLSVYGAVGNPSVWEPLLTMAAMDRIDLKRMVTHHFSLEEIGDAFAAMEDRSQGVLKAVVHPW